MAPTRAWCIRVSIDQVSHCTPSRSGGAIASRLPASTPSEWPRGREQGDLLAGGPRQSGAAATLLASRQGLRLVLYRNPQRAATRHLPEAFRNLQRHLTDSL